MKFDNSNIKHVKLSEDKKNEIKSEVVKIIRTSALERARKAKLKRLLQQ